MPARKRSEYKQRLTRLALAGMSLVVLAMPVSANASIPSLQDRVDAKRFARDWWASRNWHYGDGVPNCYGVRFKWRSWHRDPGIRRQLAYVHTAADCTIVFNKRAIWPRVPERNGDTTNLGPSWWRFCATAIHEWGHLRGMPYNWRNPPVHSRSPDKIMAATEMLNTRAWWWPYFPGCRYEGDEV